MGAINHGEFRGHVYHKTVSFNKAVLWMTKEISLPPTIVKQFRDRGITKVVFTDRKKGEEWSASVDTLREHKRFAQVGQEAQFYFPIEVFTKHKINNEEDRVLS